MNKVQDLFRDEPFGHSVVVSIDDEQNVGDALKILANSNISSAPVKDGDGFYVGFISMIDIAFFCVAKVFVGNLGEEYALQALDSFYNKKGSSSFVSSFCSLH
jgi:CBS domain-containing protein